MLIASQLPPVASQVRLGVVAFDRSARRDAAHVAEVPPRPLAVRSSRRPSEWGECTLALGDGGEEGGGGEVRGAEVGGGESRSVLCASLDETALLTPLVPASERAAPGAVRLLSPTALPALRVHRYMGPSSAPPRERHSGGDGRHTVDDRIGAESFAECAAAEMGGAAAVAGSMGGTAVVAAPSEADERRAWMEEAKAAMTGGDGLAMLRGGLSRDEARMLRAEVFAAIPEAKRTTRVFANHM